MSSDAPGAFRPVLVRVLAVIGALALLGTASESVAGRLIDPAATGTIENEDGSPGVGVPVFLDRGTVIERYVTDSGGHFRLPLSRHEQRRAAWLICAPASLPMVGYDRGIISRHVTYQLNTHDVRLGQRSAVRGFGWSAPVPRECVHADTMTYWRGPVDSANAPVPMMPSEPDWSTYRSAARDAHAQTWQRY